MELKNTIKHVKESCKEAGIKPDDNHILEVAQKIYVSGEINKKEDNSKPTEKQISVMNGKDFKDFYPGNTEQLSRAESTQLIKEFFSKRKTNHAESPSY